jgi:hypothetical protein
VAAQVIRRVAIRGTERRSKMGQGATGEMAELVAPFIGRGTTRGRRSRSNRRQLGGASRRDGFGL